MFLKIMVIVMLVCHIAQMLYNNFVYKKYCSNLKILMGMGVISKHDNKISKSVIRKMVPLLFLIVVSLILYSIILVTLLFTDLWLLGVCLMIIFAKTIFIDKEDKKDKTWDIIASSCRIKFEKNEKITFFKIFTIVVKAITYILIFVLL